MNQPLYGEETKEAKAFNFLCGLLTGGWVIYCLIIAFVHAPTYKSHFVIAAVLVAVSLIPFLLFRWYRTDDLEPKFKWLILFGVATVWLAGVAVNMYVWIPPPYGCPEDGQLKDITGKCYTICPSYQCLRQADGACINCSYNCNGSSLYEEMFYSEATGYADSLFEQNEQQLHLLDVDLNEGSSEQKKGLDGKKESYNDKRINDNSNNININTTIKRIRV